MGELSARQKYILSLMFDARLVNIKQLSRQMDVSERTIQREVSAINRLMEIHSIKLVMKNPILHVEGTNKDIEQVKKELGGISKPQLLATDQRILFIMAQLLIANEPYKSAFFSYQLDVAEATISMYMEKIEKHLIRQNLFLSRQRAFGIQIDGSEWDKRNALVELIYAYKPTEDLLTHIYDTQTDLTTKLLFDVLFGKEILKYTRDVLDFAADKILDEDDIEYLKAFLYIAISLKKAQSGNPIQLSNAFMQDVCSNNMDLYSSLQQFFKTFPIPVSENEIAYIFIHLPGNQYQHSMNQHFEALGIPLAKLSEEVLYEIRKRGGIHFQIGKQSLDGFLHQLNFSISRAYMGIHLQNPLLDQVHSHYGNVYDAVKYACDLVFSKYNIHLSENEIGYITMYIGYMNDCEEPVYDTFSVLIVCPNGVGAARILAARVKKLFPDVQTIEINSMKGWEENDREYDLILSTVDIKNLQYSKSQHALVVSPFLPTEDIQLLNESIEAIKREKNSHFRKGILSSKLGYPNDRAAESIRKMLEHVAIEKLEADSMWELIQAIATQVQEKAIVTSQEEIQRLILEREKMGSVVIPNSRLAILHTRSETVVEPYVGIYRLNGQIMLHNPKSNDEPVDTFVVLLARKDEYPSILEKLGNISITLISDPSFITALRAGEAGEIRQKVAEVLAEQASE